MHPSFNSFKWLIFSVFFLFFATHAQSQKVPPAEPNPQITEIISKVSADSIKAYIEKLVSFETRHTLSDTVSDTKGIGAARRWIKQKFESFSQRNKGRLKVYYDRYVQQPTRRINSPVEIVNVVAELPAKQKSAQNRYYIVSGHYDSRVSDPMNATDFAPGANDDASGTAAVIELARVMSAYDFDANIIFMTVAAEEQGLFGAAHFAKVVKEKGYNVEAMFTNDIIGNSKNDQGVVQDDVVRVFAQGIPPNDSLTGYERTLLSTGGENDTHSRQLARLIEETARQYTPNFKVNIIYRKDRYLRGGDHSPFLDAGFSAVRFSEPNEVFSQQHQDVRVENGIQYGDLVRFVDFNYIQKVTRLNAAALAHLAQAPARPKGVGVLVSGLTNSTTLKWEANTEEDLKGYEILWRSTHAPYWEYSKFVGNQTQFTIEGVSKDSYLFGVRAVDNDNHKSPAVYPLPTR